MTNFQTNKFGLVLPTLFLMLLSALFLMLPEAWAGKYYWASNYGGTGQEEGWSIQNTADGGYVVTGYTTSFGGEGRSKFWVLKLKEDGTIQWQKTYNYKWDIAELIQQTSDGGYVVAGYTWSYSLEAWDVWILKLDANGAIQWQKIYGGQKDDQATSIQQTSDGGYVVAGETKSYGAGNWDVWVLKLDGNGNIQWQKTYGGTNWDSTSADPIQQTSDGGYIVSGRTASFGAGGYDVWVLKLDQNGAIQWQKTYGGPADELARAVRQTSDGGYVVAGYTKSYGAGNWDVWILKLDGNGIPQWQKTYGGTNEDVTYSIWETTDGGSVFAGGTESFGAGSSDVWIVKLDGNGNIQWQRTYGKAGWDDADSIRQTPNGGYIVAGVTDSFGADYDVCVLRLDGTGNIPGCTLIKTSGAEAVNTAVAGVVSQAKTSNSGATVTLTSIAPKTSAATVGTACQAAYDPVPDIKANGSDNSITVSKSTPVAITISLDPGSQVAQNADWWVVESAPDGWYYYDVIGGSWSFLPGLSVTYQGSLFNFASFGVLNTSALPVGTYTFYFGVDMNMNGLLDFDQLSYDSIVVNVKE